jgi:gas vesicle protein
MNARNNSILSLLGGAAAGAIAMYLLDPDQGQRRREQVTTSAGGAIGGAGEALGNAWGSVSEHAKTLGASLAAGASAAGGHVSDAARDFSRSNTVRGAEHAAHDAGSYLTSLGHDLLGRARSLGERLSGGVTGMGQSVAGRSHDAADYARGAASSARESVGSWFSREEEKESHLFAHTVGTAAVVALGAGAMYFLDPERGRARRAWAGQKVGSIVNDTGRAFHRAGLSCSHMMNRTRGTAHELRQSVVSAGPVSAEQLLQRVRSEMGHVVSQAHQIQVMTDANGQVELTGRVLASELDALLTAVRRVAGVSQVTNRLEVLDRADQMPAGSTGAVPQM